MQHVAYYGVKRIHCATQQAHRYRRRAFTSLERVDALKKLVRRLGISLAVSAVVYLAVCIGLIFWPVPANRDVKNYDFSSIRESAANAGLGREQGVPMRDGLRLFTRVYESKSRDTLLLLHGSGSESRYLSQLATYLSSNNIFRVVTPDLRGHGRNPGPRGDIAYLGQLDDDIEDLIRWLQKTYPGTHIVLGGHSSGGGLALRYVGDGTAPQPSALLLLAPYLGHAAPTVRPNSGDWVTVAVKRWVGIAMLNNLNIHYFNKLPVLFFNRPSQVNDALQVPAYSWRMAVNFAPNNYQSDIGRISVPTLVLVGAKDESFYPEQFARVFHPAKAYVDVSIIAGINHLNLVDSPDSFARIQRWKTERLATDR